MDTRQPAICDCKLITRSRGDLSLRPGGRFVILSAISKLDESSRRDVQLLWSSSPRGFLALDSRSEIKIPYQLATNPGGGEGWIFVKYELTRKWVESGIIPSMIDAPRVNVVPLNKLYNWPALCYDHVTRPMTKNDRVPPFFPKFPEKCHRDLCKSVIQKVKRQSAFNLQKFVSSIRWTQSES